MKRVYIGADHAGYEFKEMVKKLLDKKGIPYEDLVKNESEAAGDDYVDYAKAVSELVVSEDARGILICGSGTGMVMAANKVKGVRASLAYDEYSAKMARMDNDANILTLRAREFPKRKLKRIVLTWLSTPFSELERHKIRIAKMMKLD